MRGDGQQANPGAEPPHVQTKREIEATLASAALRPKKRLGQHFLIDGNLMRRLVEVADVSPDDIVLEVGAGTGGLTDLLAARAGRVVSVEVDRDLFALLEDRFAAADNVTLLNVDVLERKHELAPAVAEYLGVGERPRRTVKLVANLPYHVATPLLMNLLIDYPCVSRYVFTVQAEVGDRLAAEPGTRDYGPLAIIVQTLSGVDTIARLSPQVFWPRPAVDSVMMRIDVGPMPFTDRDELRRFASLVRKTFEHRRKTLRSALGFVVDETTRDRVCAQFDGTRRPECFGRSEWRGMFECVESGFSTWSSGDGIA